MITWKDYEIQMAGFNRIGTGKFSKSITVKTREGSKSTTSQTAFCHHFDWTHWKRTHRSFSNCLFLFFYYFFFIKFLAPEAAPTQVRAEAVNSTTIRVWWKPPDPQLINGINQGYKLQAWRGTFHLPRWPRFPLFHLSKGFLFVLFSWSRWSSTRRDCHGATKSVRPIGCANGSCARRQQIYRLPYHRSLFHFSWWRSTQQSSRRQNVRRW